MRKLAIIMGFMLTASCFLASCGNEEQTAGVESRETGQEQSVETITLTAVSFLPIDDPLTVTLHDWVKEVEKVTEGRVKIDWKGGPDIIPISEQFQALQSGVVDVLFTYTGQYQTQLPSSFALPLSKLKPWEERENGLYEAMVEEHETIGVRYLGRWLTGSPRIWLTKPVEKLEDLKGMKIRSAPNYKRFFQELGISAVMIDPAEVYTSLQTGYVEGFVYGGLLGPRKNGWTDSAKYILDHPFWNQNCTILMSQEKWDRITEEDQQKIIAATADYEREMVAYFEQEEEKERKELEKIGVKFIQFPPSDAEKFLTIAYDVEWEFIRSEVPDKVDELRKLTER